MGVGGSSIKEPMINLSRRTCAVDSSRRKMESDLKWEERHCRFGKSVDAVNDKNQCTLRTFK